MTLWSKWAPVYRDKKQVGSLSRWQIVTARVHPDSPKWLSIRRDTGAVEGPLKHFRSEHDLLDRLERLGHVTGTVDVDPIG